MVIKKKYLLLILLNVFYLIAYPCSCIGPNTFCETISKNGIDIHESAFIFLGQIDSKNQEGISVKIIRTLHGDASLSSIFITSGNGGDCYKITHDFQINAQFIFAIGSDGPVFRLFDCGVDFLPVAGNRVFGRIAPGIVSTTINQLLNLPRCPKFKLKFDFEIFPNPSSSRTFFNLELKEEVDVEITLYNAAGQRVYQEAWPTVTSLNEEFPSKDFPSGVYIVQLKAFDNTFYRKMIKSR